MQATLTNVDDMPPSPVAERLLAHAGGDKMFRGPLSDGFLWVNGNKVKPTALDAAVSTIARRLISDDCNAVALAFPRGRGPQAAMLGLGLTFWRHAMPGRLCGSVVISTARGDVSKGLRDLRYDGTDFNKLAVGRVVAENVPGSGGVDLHGRPRPPRKRAAVRPLDRSPRRGLSQADGFLLFARPNTLPPLAANVVWAMVVDTVGTAGPSLFARPGDDPDSWTRTWDSNVAAGRKQVWVGELEAPAFQRFCADHHIPMVSFDWPLVEQLARAGTGVGPLTSFRLTARASQRPAVAYRVVEDGERDYFAREVYTLLRKLRERGGGDHAPDVVKVAYKLCGLLCRLPCTTQAYEAAAGGNRFSDTVDRMWKTVDNARPAAFVGRGWKDGFDRYWDPIRSSLKKLIRLQEDSDTCSKYEALIERVGEAQGSGERLRIFCQTNAERAAVKGMLHEFGVDEDQVTVHSFGARFDHGPDGKTVTVLVGPPPPWKAAMLVSGEEGHIEVLCYRHEIARLRARVREAEHSHESENTMALNRLDLGAATTVVDIETEADLAELPGYAVRDTEEPEDEWSKEVPTPDSMLWKELLEQFGLELPDGDSSDDMEEGDAAPTTPYDGLARLVRFTDAPPVFMRNDAVADVLLDEKEDDSLTSVVPVGELEEGMTIAFLAGGQRSLVDVLLAAYDQRLSLEAKMFEPLWDRARRAAVANVGIEGLAALTERTPAAVRAWVSGRNIPQQSWRFKKLLEASGDTEAMGAQQALWNYLTATRGPHRVIGKLNRLAIAEAARDDPEQKQLKELEHYVGHDLEDFYDQVEPVTVMSVSEPVAVPLSRCGRYLPEDDPYLRSCS